MVLMNVSIPTTLKFQTTWLALQTYIFLPVDTDNIKMNETVPNSENQKQEIKEKLHDLLGHSGASEVAEIAKVENVPGTKMYLNVTTGNLKMDDEDQWRKIFSLGKKISLHAEGETFFRLPNKPE